jgi:hypothetical protein
MSDAVIRIETSRARLRLAMLPPPPTAKGAPETTRSWWSRMSRIKTISAVVESVEAWWANHPLRPVAGVAVEASDAVIQPLAKRHPLALVGVAALAGASLVWSRPWRWALRSALFAGLLPQLASRVVSSLPIESWINMVSSTRAAAAGSAPRETTETPEPDLS